MSEEAKLEMPTARDAVAGMLLRRGLAATARDVAEGRVQQAAETLRGHLAGPGVDACRAALEALARGDLHGAADHQGLLAEVRRLRARDAERDAKAMRLLADAGDPVARAFVNAPVVDGKPDADEPQIDVLRPDGFVPHEVVLQQLLECAKVEHVAMAAEIARLRERETTQTLEHNEQYGAVKVLREALRRMAAHLEVEGRAGDGISETAWDDYHAARMLVGRANAGWDAAAAGRGIESIRRDALGVESGAPR